jgi:NADH-quinone oxidoreductase subunit L
VIFGLIGIGVAWWLYAARRDAVPRLAWLQDVLEHKFYWDELYDTLFYRPAVWLAKACVRWIERPVVAGAPTELAAGTRESGRLLSYLQTGLVRTYALAVASGLAVLVVVFISVR